MSKPKTAFRHGNDSPNRITRSDFIRASLTEFTELTEPLVIYQSKRPILAVLPVDEMNALLIAAGREPLSTESL